MKKLILALLLSTAAIPAHARDLYNFHALGFSADGKYYAFAESVQQDGSGFATADVSVLDVAANKLVASKTVTLQQDNATEQQALDQAIRGAALGRYGIDGRHTGEDLLVRVRTDRSNYTDTVFTTYYYRTYRLAIDATNLPERDECLGNQEQLLKLTLTSAEEGNDLRKVLQEDTALPKSRGCAGTYEVARVTRQGDSLVVIVSYTTPGFEGANLSYMAVSTKIQLQ